MIEKLQLGIEFKTQGDEVKFIKRNFEYYEIKIPASQSKGGIYYMDEGLRELIDKSDDSDLGTFVKIGQEMAAKLHISNLKAFVEILNTKFKLTIKVESIKVEEKQEIIQTGEFEFKLSKTFGAGAYPPLGFNRHVEGEGYGSVVFDRNLPIKVRLIFSLVPMFKTAEDAVKEWMESLSPLQEEALDQFIAEKSSKINFLHQLGIYITSTNVIGNQEYTFGTYSELELAEGLAKIKHIKIKRPGKAELELIIRQLNLLLNYSRQAVN